MTVSLATVALVVALLSCGGVLAVVFWARDRFARKTEVARIEQKQDGVERTPQNSLQDVSRALGRIEGILEERGKQERKS